MVPSPPPPLKALVARQLLHFQSVGTTDVPSLFVQNTYINSLYSLTLSSAQSLNADQALTSKGFSMEFMLQSNKMSLWHPRNASAQRRGPACFRV